MNDFVPVDTRYPTKLEFLMGGDVINVSVGVTYQLAMKLTRADDGSPINGKPIYLYVNDVKADGFVNTGATGIPGVAVWEWVFDKAGLFHFKAVFSVMDWEYQPSNEAKLVAVAELVPASIFFDVKPREFKPGTELTLSAQVINTTSGGPLCGFDVKFYRVMADGSQHYLGEDYTNSTGWATLTHTYSLGLGVYTFLVNVSAVKVVVVSPTMIKVANSSYLHLGLGRTEGSSSRYTVSGMLLSFFGVPDKPVKVYVNDTLAGTATTYGRFGKFNLSLNLPPVDNKPTLYNVKAVFEGDDPQNVTSYLYTPNGTRYAVCSTVHYGYEPAVNYAAVTVEPMTSVAPLRL